MLSALCFAWLASSLLESSALPEQKFANLDKRYLLPFVHEDHIKTAPEMLHFYLDRENILAGVLEYIKKYSQVISGEGVENPAPLFPTMVDRYQENYQQYSHSIAQEFSKQKN